MAEPVLVTATEFEAMGTRDFELVRGRLVPLSPTGDSHGHAAVILAAELRAFVRSRRLGRVRAETGFILSRHPDTVRGPDVSFVATGKPAGDRSGDGFIPGAPDLAIEIISPSNTREQIAEKVREYLSAGSRLVWVVDTERRVLHVERAGVARRTIDADGQLAGEDVVPGFRYPLRALFEELDVF